MRVYWQLGTATLEGWDGSEKMGSLGPLSHRGSAWLELLVGISRLRLERAGPHWSPGT